MTDTNAPFTGLLCANKSYSTHDSTHTPLSSVAMLLCSPHGLPSPSLLGLPSTKLQSRLDFLGAAAPRPPLASLSEPQSYLLHTHTVHATSARSANFSVSTNFPKVGRTSRARLSSLRLQRVKVAKRSYALPLAAAAPCGLRGACVRPLALRALRHNANATVTCAQGAARSPLHDRRSRGARV